MSNTYKSLKKGRQVDSAIDYIEKLPQKLTDIELSIKETNNNKADKVSIPKNLSDLIDNITQQNYDANSSSPQSGKAIAEAIAKLLGSAPENLDTLEELAKALNEDENFSATVLAELAAKADAKTEDGGFQGGNGAFTRFGGAVGGDAYSEEGGAVGFEAFSITGGAVGRISETITGGAVGDEALSGMGFSGGYKAQVDRMENEEPIDAIQLGIGKNSKPKTLQIYEHTLLDADGTIPEERLTKAKDYTDKKVAEAVEGVENINISAEQTVTGVIITITDRDGVQTSVHISTLMTIKTWEDVKNAVRLGLGDTLFPVGYEFTTEDSVTGAVITWVVRGHDNHIAANKNLTHTMTLETKYVYGTTNGTYRSFVFDATEALYYAAEELPAGTYNFTLLADYDATYGGGKTLSFTLTKPVPAGGVIMFPWAYQKQSTDTKISTYASNAATAVIESVAVTESADGTSLGVADGTVENLNHTHRIRYGSNNYAQSAVRQWLNSDAAAGAVWAPTNKFDRRPSWATSYSGFMLGLPAEFLAAVQPAAIPCRTNSVFEVNSFDGTEFTINQVYTLKDKFFLLSRPEIYGTWDNATYKDGTLLEFYEGLTDTERIKYDAAGSARSCWLRSPDPGLANLEHDVHTSGALSRNGVYSAFGVAPACIIA